MSDTTSKDPSKMRIFYSKCIEYTSMIRVYLLTFLFCFSIGLTMIPASQFIQDKICLNNLALPAYVCFDIHTRTEYSKHAVDIYQRSTSFSSLQTVITFLPSIFIAVFLGRWLDKYPRYVKYAMALPTLGLSIGSIFSLYFAVNFHLGNSSSPSSSSEVFLSRLHLPADRVRSLQPLRKFPALLRVGIYLCD